MKKDSEEALESYKIRIDALEIINEAYLAKIEALELLNRNLQFLRDVRNQTHGNTATIAPPAQSVARPVAQPVAQTVARPVKSAPVVTEQTEPAQETEEKRGRGRPRKYPEGTNYYALKLAEKEETGEKRGRGRPRKYPVATSGATEETAEGQEPGEKRGRGRPRKYPVGSTPSTRTPTLLESGERRGRGRPRKYPEGTTTVVKTTPSFLSGKRRRSSRVKKLTGITRLQIPLEIALREILHDESYNKATYRALTGILLCLFENKTATVTNLHEYIGGSKVTVVRHTAALKKMKLITYEGSRKKGNYALTPQGNHLYERLLSA